ncbi:hypothetical protein AVEN_5409-1 [Araneus ventricosus]|uniref:Gustatory receptor n=1 Tax=Araneus ventricosus TaxID=182803 RepID=A0A4Y2FLC8_ARAVE|nr:hypothetical protein AVEN_116859-1 [Araneus ventricosus]GBN06148.1 hypothetical protein AVEN_5409-1 [Araneus ventricosus]
MGFTATATRQLSSLVAFSVWLSLMFRRKEISKLLKDLNNLAIFFGASVNVVIIRTCGFIVFLVPIMAWISKFVLFEEIECKHLMGYYSLDSVGIPDGQNCKVLAFIASIFSFIFFVPPAYTSVFYVIVCLFFRKVLNIHSITGSRKVTNCDYKMKYSNMKNYLLKYEYVLEFLKHFEETMSLPIFLIQAGDLVGMFSGFIWLNARMNNLIQNGVLRNTYLGIFFISFYSFVSFMSVSLAASSVHEAGKKYKETEEKLLKNVLTSMQENDTSGQFLLLVAHENPPFILSAWGFFYFTKGLILVAVGSVLTYSLLIIQITSYKT